MKWRLVLVALVGALGAYLAADWWAPASCALSCAADPDCHASFVVGGECKHLVVVGPRSASEPPAPSPRPAPQPPEDSPGAP